MNRAVWRWVLVTAGGGAAAWLLLQLFGTTRPVPYWIGVILTLAAWGAAVRMLLLDARFRVFWLIWLGGGLALLFSLPRTSGIWLAALSFSAVFLLFRRYRPYRHLTSRRKAALFLIALLMFTLMSIVYVSRGQESVSDEIAGRRIETTEPGTTSPLRFYIYRYAAGSLEMFWFFSLFHLFFAIRLHFMRLKPKLAVVAFMLVVVPLFLVTVMGLITLYATLGESRAIRAANLMQNWAETAGRDNRFLETLCGETRVYHPGGNPRAGEPEPPDWVSVLFERARVPGGFDFAGWDPAEQGHYLWAGTELWLVVLENPNGSGATVRAGRVDAVVMNRLAGLLHCDARLLFSSAVTFQGGPAQISITPRESSLEVIGRHGREKDTGTSLWQRRLYFGASHLGVLAYHDRDLSWQTVLLLLEGRLENVIGELASSRNPVSQAVLVVLAVLAAMLLVLELFALFFGMRITAGFTSAVGALHRGARKIAGGELDTRIDIPNQDELGDLAAAFNEMAAAVKQGREEAVARERLEGELKTARKIQEKLLPDDIPEIPGFQITGTSLPSHEVGGDYFDFLDMGDGRLGIAIGDVSGKGIPAALLMANLQASLHAQALRSSEAAETVSRINDLLVRSTDPNMFATFFYGVLDRRSSTFFSTNAGHNPPILARASGEIERLDADGLILGFMADQHYTGQSTRFHPGDVLVLYTDGITEAVRLHADGSERELFGDARLIELIGRKRRANARAIHAEILSAVSRHSGQAPQSDDITLVVIKRREAGEEDKGTSGA